MNGVLAVMVILTYAGTVAGLLRYIKDQQKTWDEERQTLLNRIVAPSVVPTETMPVSDGTPKHITVEDDKGFKDYYESVGS